MGRNKTLNSVCMQKIAADGPKRAFISMLLQIIKLVYV